MKVAIAVWHKGEYKMCGKVFPHPKTGELIFLHEESGNQGHTNLAAPGGIDTVILPDLHEWKVTSVYHFNRKERSLYVTGLVTLSQRGSVQTSGGRKRVYLPNHHWHIDYFPAGLPFKAPWCSTIQRYGGRLPGTQLSLPGMDDDSRAGGDNRGIKQSGEAGGETEGRSL